MIKVKIKDNKHIGLIEIPKLAFYFDWGYCSQHDSNNNPKIQIYWETEDDRLGGIITKFITPNQFDILNKLSQLDKELEEFVDKVENILNPFQIGDDDNIYFEDYSKSYPELFKTAKESFISLLESEGIDTSKEYLVIKIL